MVSYSSGADPYATALGLVAQAFPIQAVSNNNLGATSGVLIGALVRPTGAILTNLGLWLGTAGGTSTGASQMGLYSEVGELLASTGDMTAALTSAGNNSSYVEAALSAPAAVSTSANYYIALLAQLTVNPTIAGSFSGSGFPTPTVKGHKPSFSLSGQTALPAAVTIGSTTTPAADFWLAAS